MRASSPRSRAQARKLANIARTHRPAGCGACYLDIAPHFPFERFDLPRHEAYDRPIHNLGLSDRMKARDIGIRVGTWDRRGVE